MLKKLSLIFSIGAFLSFSLIDEQASKELFDLVIPNHFPKPIIPKGNELTKSRVELGEKLFFDKIMSRDRSLSCASCHNPSLAFTDCKTTSIGIRGQKLDRNSPTLINVAYQDSGLLFDRGVPTLEMQVLVPVQEHKEFDFDLKLIAERLKKDTNYVALSYKAYERAPSPFVITRAIASYERTLISGDSPYDKYINGNKELLNDSEKRGMNIFFNKLNCSQCHSGFNFTNLSLENNGLYNNPYPLDSGRMRISHQEKDRDLFKVPTLRNIDLTSPYMHDGSIKTLEDVINHYSSGGRAHINKSKLIEPFDISEEEKEDLINFLKSLTDSTFITRYQ